MEQLNVIVFDSKFYREGKVNLRGEDNFVVCLGDELK